MSQPPSEAPVHHVRLERFTTAERWVHRTLGIVLGVLIVTGALLFFPALGSLIGNRQIVSTIHEWTGWLVPIPLLLALASRAFRQDAGRLNRFRPTDWEWLRSRDRRSGRIPVGKFNAGQKLNSALTLGSVIVLFATGMIMFWSGLFPETIRTGATFVHDWLSLAFGILVLGHIYMAFNDATARLGMRTGYVPEDWARREHGAWATEVLDRR
jgi:formate dehydrogenase subunit gamma